VRRVTNHDVVYGYRLRLFDLAARTSVASACRVFGVHRSTYYAWKHQVDRHGLEMLRPRERRRPAMPNQTPLLVEQRILAFALAHPGYGPRRGSSELARERWGGIVVSPVSVWRVLRRHGLNTRSKRLSLVAGYAAPPQPERLPPPEPHITTTRPGELVGMDCFFVGRLRGTHGAVWQITAIDTYSSYAWADLVVSKVAQPTSAHTSRLARRVAHELRQCGWRLERVIVDNGNEYRSHLFTDTLTALDTRKTHIHAGRPQTNRHAESLHRTILEECWRAAVARSLQPRSTSLRRELDSYLDQYNTDRPHHGRTTQRRIPIDIIDPAHKMRAAR
jgi:transposase InsO family protein